jgi:farnesyl diphosphate synthase
MSSGLGLTALCTGAAVAGMASMAMNAEELLKLPTSLLFQLVGSMGFLILLTVVSVFGGNSSVEKPKRYPATEWPQPLNEGDPRKGYPKYNKEDNVKSFTAVNERLIAECVDDLDASHEVPEKEKKWLKDMLEYNVKGGKMNRGLMVVISGELVLKEKNIPCDSEMLTKLAVLGWCIEWLQAWLLVADDYMDDSQTRRGQPCWYKLPNVQQIAINDAFILEMFVYRVLKRHFWAEPYYHQLVDLFMETTFQTECGQLLDLQCMNLGLDDFTFERWELIVKYKTAFYSFYLPVALGMTVASVSNRSAYDAAREPLIKMGIYFQAQDDYLDCFATPEVLGKIGTDIQDKKCGWLFVNAYHKYASPAQKKFLQEHYGKCKVDSPEELEIRKMYKDLGLEKLYQQYEQQSYDEIMAMRAGVERCGLPWAVFEVFLKKVYKRSK